MYVRGSCIEQVGGGADLSSDELREHDGWLLFSSAELRVVGWEVCRRENKKCVSSASFGNGFGYLYWEGIVAGC